LQAGVPAVVGTLWPVADISTALLLARFYRYHLQDGLDAAMALHQAQAWLRDSTAAEMNLADWSERCYEASGRTNGDALWWMRYGQANPGEKPFAHPYYWAAFAFSGVGV
jgi:CHAT domain-containing protein